MDLKNIADFFFITYLIPVLRKTKKMVVECFSKCLNPQLSSGNFKRTYKVRETSFPADVFGSNHGLQTPSEEIAFTARAKIKSQSQVCIGTVQWKHILSAILPIISGFFDLCLHWVSVVRGSIVSTNSFFEISQDLITFFI